MVLLLYIIERLNVRHHQGQNNGRHMKRHMPRTHVNSSEEADLKLSRRHDDINSEDQSGRTRHNRRHQSARHGHLTRYKILGISVSVKVRTILTGHKSLAYRLGGSARNHANHGRSSTNAFTGLYKRKHGTRGTHGSSRVIRSQNGHQPRMITIYIRSTQGRQTRAVGRGLSNGRARRRHDNVRTTTIAQGRQLHPSGTQNRRNPRRQGTARRR